MPEEKVRFGTVLDPKDPYQKEFIAMSKKCSRKGQVLIGIMAHELVMKYGLNEENMDVLLPILLKDYKLIQTLTEHKADYKELAILLENSGNDFVRLLSVMAKEFFSSFGLSEKVTKEELLSIINNYDWIKAAQKSYLCRPFVPINEHGGNIDPPHSDSKVEKKEEKKTPKENADGPSIEDVMLAFPGLQM